MKVASRLRVTATRFTSPFDGFGSMKMSVMFHQNMVHDTVE